MKKIIPKGAWLTVNQECNFRCVWCYAAGTGYKEENAMSLELASELTKLIFDIGIRGLIIIGGEPTLWRHLLTFNDYCKQLGMRTSLVTNAYLLGVDKFWDEYRKSPNDSIGISLKAGNSKQLLEVAGVKNFNVVKKGVMRAVKNLNGCVSITYNSFYAENLPELVSLATECGSKPVKIDFCSTVFKNGKPCGEYMVEPHQIAENILRDYEVLNRITEGNLVFEMNLPFCLWPEDFIQMLITSNRIISVCHLMKREGIIFDPEGRLIMCNGLFDYPLGQYGKDFDGAESLLRFINSERIANFYAKMSNYPSLDCKKCKWYGSCGGGCPLRWTLYKPKNIICPVRERR